MQEFIFDVILEAYDICNMKKEAAQFLAASESGKRMVIYGLRNTGKTSLLKSLVIPAFKKRNKNAMVVFCDFMGVETRNDINSRLRAAFEHAYASAFPIKSNLRQILAEFKNIRPNISVESSGDINFSLTSAKGENPAFEDILAELNHIVKTHPVLLVFDEFQDIGKAKQAEALFRNALQNFPSSIPVFIMGSKQHLLANIFAKPKAAFYNWGEDLTIEPLPYDEYYKYMSERFEPFGMNISLKVSKFLQNRLQRNPESVNIVCKSLVESLCGKKHTIVEEDIEPAITRVIQTRGKRFEQYLSSFSPSQLCFLTLMAKDGVVMAPQGKDFVARLGISATAVRKAQIFLEHEAIIANSDKGYFLTDPLLAAYLRYTR